ncbi:MAG: DUF167 domain-containing protein [Planctomycetota bacterium]
MIKLQKTSAGYVVPMLVTPGASQNAVRGEHAGRMKVAVTAPPEGGKANDALTDLLARKLDVSKSNITILSGHRSQEKEVLVERVSSDALDAII